MISMGQTRWLDEREQGLWRQWVAAASLLPDRLSRDLQESHGISLPDYEILVRLSESPDRRVRMSDLAEQTLSSRSKLSHQIDRMERGALVERQLCTEDRRGQWCVLTPTGWDLLVAAAPSHVDSVRRHLVDVLSPSQFEALGQACGLVAERLVQQELLTKAEKV
jgi:DNA-binding MarR family transcriptional regulator